MKVMTLGYEGKSIDQYIALLGESNVGVVIDVRETAWSYKKGFSKTPLAGALQAAGIAYVHMKTAGNPSSNRKTARTRAECLRRYRSHLKHHPECLTTLLAEIREAHRAGRPACLTCYERVPSECHRSILIEALSSLARGLRAVHIGTGPP